MTRTDVVASSRPQATGTTPTTRTRGAFRGGWLLPVALSVAALALPSAALAAEGTTGYGQTPSTPTTTPSTTPTTTPATTPAPTTTAAKETTPSKETSPSKETAPSKATTPPFTGLDLRWTIAVGLLLMGAGFAIVGVQRRHRRGSGS